MDRKTCERIIWNINKILESDEHLDEYDIIPSPGNVNRSPVIHVEHKLGIESWCLKYVYAFAYAEVFKTSKISYRTADFDIKVYLNVCLLLVPEVVTFWNIRRKKVSKGTLDIFRELHFARLILSRKPKCLEAYQYRRWIIKDVILRNVPAETDLYTPNTLNELKEFFSSELDLCGVLSSKHYSNYHSWDHRLWVIKQLLNMPLAQEILYKEYNNMHMWINNHVSEHSGINYLENIVDIILTVSSIVGHAIVPDTGNPKKYFLNELNFIKEIMSVFPEHESLFYFRRFLLLRLERLLNQETNKPILPPPMAQKWSCLELPTNGWPKVVDAEYSFLTDYGKRNKAQNVQGERHHSWLEHFLYL